MNLAESQASLEKGERNNSSFEGEPRFFKNPEALEQLFKAHYKDLCRYSLRFVKQEEIAEELVQDVFIKLWQKEEQLQIHTSIKAYLYTAVRNNSVNYLKSQHAKQRFEGHSLEGQLLSESPEEIMNLQELTMLVEEAVDRLPPKCRDIFQMSRSAGFTYEEIAKEMKISPKTVENQIGIALKKLKTYLQAYWDILLVVLIILSNTNGSL